MGECCGKNEEQAIRLLMQIEDAAVAPVLAKVLAKHAENVRFTRDILEVLLGLNKKGMVDRSVLSDVRAFADKTRNDKLRSHAMELVRSLE